MKRKLFALLFVLNGLIIQAQVYTVGTGGNYPTLTLALNATTGAPAGSTLELLESQTCNNLLVSKNYTIKKSSSVSGEVFLNCGTGRHFTVGANIPVTFQDLTFVGPNVSGGTTVGGGVGSTGAGASATLNNCIMNGCRAASGGAVGFTNVSQSLTLDNTTVTNCSASGNGGGINCSGTLIVNNSTINNNIATGSGGGIYCSGTLTLKNVTISDNKAGWNGASYSGNNNGGGLYSGGNAVFQEIISIERNNAAASGGGIYNSAGTVFDVTGITSFTVRANTANSAAGGGIFLATVSGGTTIDFPATATVGIKENKSKTTGGGIHTAGILTLSNVSISGNTAETTGGGIHAANTLTLENATVSENKSGYDGTNYIAGNNNGGGIYAANALTLIGSIAVKDNTAGNSGGGILKTSTGVFNADALLSFSVEGNTANGLGTTAPGSGGGIYSSVALNLSNIHTVIRNNTANVSGGGVYITSAFTLDNATISDNVAYVSGGGIWISTSGLTMRSSTISNNTAGNNGGGIFSATINNAGNFITGTDLILSDNKAGWDFSSNDYSGSLYSGGGIYASGPLSFEGTLTIKGNTATGDGGAVFKLTSAGTAFDVTQVKTLGIIGNISKKGNGGALYSPYELSFVNLTSGAVISNNKAESGSGGAVYTLTDFSIIESTISGNSAQQNGGALYVKGILNLSNATLSGNDATLSGGAIYKDNGTGSTTIEKSLFYNNVAGTIGGAINSVSSNASQEIGNCTFFQNSAQSDGGAVYLKAGSISVYFCTFNANQTGTNTSNAIYWGGNALKLNGNIIYGNGSGNNSEVTNAGTTVAARYNVVREQTFSGTTNQTVGSGSGATIFSSVDNSNPDLAVLGNNGGPTQTIMIKKGGLAHGKIPLSTALGFGSSASLDQRGENRTNVNLADIGSVQLPPDACDRENQNPTVWYVDLQTSSPGDGSDIATPAVNLHEVLNNLCLLSGDTIKVAAGTYYSTDTDPANSFLINKAIVLLGGYKSNFVETERNITSNLTVLDGKFISYTVVYFTIGNTEQGIIDGFTIQNGKASGVSGAQAYGGGIYVNAGALTLSRSLVNNNISIERGGGIYVAPPAALVVNDCKITNNKSGYDGTSFNTARSDVAANPSAASLLVRSGGGICAEGNLELQGYIYFETNESGGNGGAIYKGVQSNFVANEIDTLSITGCKSYVLDGGNGNWGGGGVYTMIDLDLSNAEKVKIEDCIANAGQGGGFFVNNKTIGRVILSISNGRFEGCRAQGANSDGGAIESYGNTTSLVILKDSYFNNCYCGRYGGALGIGNVLKLEGKIEINDCIAENNGGGITHWAITRGFPEYDEFDVKQLDTLIITNCKTTKAAGSGGAGIWIQRSHLDLSPVKHVRLENNMSASYGGGIKFEANNILTLGNAVIRANKAGTTNGTIYTSTYKGGGIYNLGAITMSPFCKIVVDGNIAGGDGGGIWCNATLTANQVDSLVISNNEAGKGSSGNGGGIYAGAVCNIAKATIITNNAKTNGGGIFANNTLTVQSCTFTQNTAVAGGGIYSNAVSAVTISNSTFSRNTASNTTTGGGAIYSSPINDAIRVALSTFVGNTSAANQANAIYFNNATNKVLNGNIIYGNGTGSEMNIEPVTANYNIIRGFTFEAGTQNKTLADGELYNIFTTGNLENNGGKTQTIMIKRGGYAQNYIPKSAVDSWTIFGVISADQRDSSRMESFADVGSVEIKTIPMTLDFRKIGSCINTPIEFKNIFTLATQNLRDTLYYSDSGHTQALPSIVTASPPYSKNLYMRLISGDNMVVDTVAPYYVFDKTTTWTPKNGTTQNWNDVANWSKGIPGACTYVIIPGGVASYPVLSQVNDSDLPLICDTIDFKFGGEVARTDYLQYNGAKVDLTVNGNRWYMIAPPLQSMFPGDFYVDNPNPVFDTNPYTSGYGLYPYAQLFSQTNPQTGKNIEGSWTGTFSNPDVILNSGSGLALWMDDGSVLGVYKPTTFTLPKHDVSYHYYNSSGVPVGTVTLNRVHENRFVYETVLNPDTKDVVLSAKAADSNKLAIVGNPFMSHLNFDKFYLQNSELINNEYKIMLADGNYGTYKIGISNIYNLNNLIAPMQSFIVESVVSFSELKANTSQMEIKAGQTLRASTSDPANKGELVIAASLHNLQNKTMVVYNPEVENRFERQKDSYKLFGKDYDDILSVYTRSSDGYALDIHSFGELDKMLPIGIKANKEGNVTLSFEGLEIFMEGYDVILFDTQAKKEVNLREIAQYTFNNRVINDYMDGRLFLIFRKIEGQGTNPTGMNDINKDNSQIFVIARNHVVQVISVKEPLEAVQIFDIQGRLLSSVHSVNHLSYFQNVPGEGIYIIKAKTRKHSFVKKVKVGLNGN